MTAVASPTERESPNQIAVYRDDGPLARLIGAALGRATGVPAPAPAFLAAVAVLAAALIGGADAPEALAVAAVLAAVVLGGVSAGRPQTGRLAWAVPPLLRATEYGAIIWLAAMAGGSAPAGAFALLAAVAFRQYDLVYRLRHRAAVPPAWVGTVGGGWDGRLAAATLLLLAGALEPALFVAAAVLGAVFVGESVTGWVRARDEVRPAMDDDDEEEGD